MSSAALVVAIVAQLLALVFAALKVAGSLGAMSAKQDLHGTLLAQHRQESREANEALAEDVSAVRGDLVDLRERMSAIEATTRWRAVKS